MNQEAVEWVIGLATTFLCLVVIPAIGFVLSYLVRKTSDNADQISKLWSKCVEIETDVRWVKMGIRTMADKMGVILHSPHTPEFDRLIESFWKGTLTDEECDVLKEKLQIRIDEQPNDAMSPVEKAELNAQKTAAATMIGALEMLHPPKSNTEHTNKPKNE